MGNFLEKNHEKKMQKIELSFDDACERLAAYLQSPQSNPRFVNLQVNHDPSMQQVSVLSQVKIIDR